MVLGWIATAVRIVWRRDRLPTEELETQAEDRIGDLDVAAIVIVQSVEARRRHVAERAP